MCVAGFDIIKEKCENDPSFIFGRDEDGYTMLHYAVDNDDLNTVEQLIRFGSCPFIYNKNGMTPLTHAALCDNESIFEFLLDKSSMGILEDDQAELMAIAASKGKYKNLKTMLKNGFNSNAYYRDDPILYWAMQSASLEIIELLYEYKADVNAVNDEGKTAIFDAAGFGLADIMEYLISRGANIDKASEGGTTPLITASCYNKTECARILLSKKCNIEAKTKDGITALLYAVNYGHIEMVQLLLDNGAEKSTKDKKNRGIEVYCNKIKNKRIKNKMIEIIK